MNDFPAKPTQNSDLLDGLNSGLQASDLQDKSHEEAIIPPPIPYQKRQTRRWLALFLGLTQLGLLLAIGWLGYKHTQLQKQLTEQKQINQTLTSQLHDIDDKLVKLEQPVKTVPNNINTQDDTADKTQLDVLKVQLQTADMLLAKADYPAVKNLLGVISYQLKQPDSGITPAMRLTLENSLQQDQQLITKLQSQPNIWQSQSLALVEIQTFLQKKHADYQQSQQQIQQQSQQQNPQQPKNTPLTYPQAQLFEMLTTLNFALQACHSQQSDLYLSYTSQLEQQAKALTPSELLGANDITQLQEMVKKINAQLPVSPRLQTSQILTNQLTPPVPTTLDKRSMDKTPHTSSTTTTTK